MIYSVRGKVIATEPELVVVECGGVGYACRTSFSTIQQVTGQDEVMLFTHLAVRENDVELFGFATKEELSSFKMLISVSGGFDTFGLHAVTVRTCCCNGRLQGVHEDKGHRHEDSTEDRA